jgi:hypothetical protein
VLGGFHLDGDDTPNWVVVETSEKLLQQRAILFLVGHCCRGVQLMATNYREELACLSVHG